jgi:hypothetical protein
MESRSSQSLLFLGFCIIASSNFAISQPYGQIVGKVADARTGKLLDDAIIWTAPQSTSTRTDSKGAYSIPRVPLGIYSIKAYAFEYEEDSACSISILPNTIDTVDFKVYSIGTSEARKDIAKGIIQLGVMGLVIRTIPEKIENKLTLKYGFIYNNNNFADRYIPGYNETVLEYLDKLNGKGWKLKFDREYDSLYQQYSRRNQNH